MLHLLRIDDRKKLKENFARVLEHDRLARTVIRNPWLGKTLITRSEAAVAIARTIGCSEHPLTAFFNECRQRNANLEAFFADARKAAEARASGKPEKRT